MTRLYVESNFILELAFEQEHRKRQRLQQDIQTELSQLRRSARYVETVQQVNLAASLFAVSAEEDRARLERVIRQIAQLSQLIPINAKVIELGYSLQHRLGLDPQDNFILASALRHLELEPSETCYFATRNTRDFDDPDVRELLTARGCHLLTDFGPVIRLARPQPED